MERFGHIDTWVFDLDNTLYNADTAVFLRIIDRMNAFVSNHLSISLEEAAGLRHSYFKKYGTTLRGLMTEHDVSPHDFLKDVHDVDISDVPPCAITQKYLAHLKGRKIIFTNAPRRHAENMLKHLGISEHFDDIFGIEDADYWPKPDIRTYHAFIQKFGIDPEKACMFEDMPVNLKPASDLGMTTVWFYGDAPAVEKHDHIHHTSKTLADWLKDVHKVKQHV